MARPVFVRGVPLVSTEFTNSASNTLDVTGCNFIDVGFGSSYNVNAIATLTCTLDGVDCPLIVASANGPNNQAKAWKFGLPLGAASGTRGVVLRWTGGQGGDRVMGWAAGWSGVHQTTPTRTPNSNVGESATASVAVASQVGDAVSDFVMAGAGADLIPAVTQTERGDVAAGTPSWGRGAASDADGVATSTTMSWTVPLIDWAHVGVALIGADEGGGDPGGGGGAPQACAEHYYNNLSIEA